MNWTSTVAVAAPPDVAWHAHSDLAGLADRTPTIDRLELLDPGPLHVGQRVRLEQPGRRPAVWRVTALEPARSYRWRTVRPGLALTGSHRVEPDGAGGSTSTLGLEVSGPLAPLVRLVGARAARRALAAENAGLREAAEAAAARG